MSIKKGQATSIRKMAQTLGDYLSPSIGNVDEYYQWPINCQKISDLTQQDFSEIGSAYEQTLKMKACLRPMLADPKSKEGLDAARFLVGEWGGITPSVKLSEWVIKARCSLDKGPEKMDDISLTGVSSWSKVVSCLYDWAPIYDSRVAFSINAINYMNGDTEAFFPMPVGRGARLSLINLESLFLLSNLRSGALDSSILLSAHVGKEIRPQFHIPVRSAYREYVRLVAQIGDYLQLERDQHCKIEMLLFALAPHQVFADLVKRLLIEGITSDAIKQG